MAEEQQEQSGGGGSLKNILLGLVSTITLGVGGWFTTKLTGGDDDKAPVQQTAPAPVININNQNQASSGGGTTKIIEREKVVEKEKPAPVKKKDGDEFKDKPAEW